MRLYPYQEDGVAFLSTRPRAALFDDPGLGKTAQILMAASRRSPLIVACSKTLKLKWREEAHKWRPDLKVRVSEPGDIFRWPRAGELFVTHFAALPHSLGELRGLEAAFEQARRERRPVALTRMLAVRARRARRERDLLTLPFAETILVCDEAHHLRNPETQAARRFREMAFLTTHGQGRVYLVTATPLHNNADELWTVLQAAGLGREAFGEKSYFDQLLATDPGEYSRRLGSVALRRARAQVLPDLPPKRRQTVLVRIGHEAAKIADQVQALLVAAGVSLEDSTAETLETALMKSVPRHLMSRLHRQITEAKIPAMLANVAQFEERGVPAVVFSRHVAPLRALEGRPGWLVVHGGHNEQERAQRVARFQAGHSSAAKGIALQSAVGGEGIDLFRAWCALHVDYPWTPAGVTQMEDRLLRPGQTAKGLHYFRLVADHPIERRIDVLQAQKLELYERGVDSIVVTGSPQQ